MSQSSCTTNITVLIIRTGTSTMSAIDPLGIKLGYSKSAKEKLSKRLCYVLRYGAIKEGLHLYSGGYVDVKDILGLKLLAAYTVKDILEQAKITKSTRGTPRFETRFTNNGQQIRAVYGHSMEAKSFHENSGVPTLLETCLSVISNKIKMYDLDEFPDLYLHNRLLRKMKREKKLNNKSLKTMLIPELEKVNLSGVYLTEKSFDIISTRGCNLKVLNIQGCGYVLNDHILEKMLRKLKNLRSLNIGGCVHLTDRSLKAIIKHVPDIVHLNASAVWNFTGVGILDLVTSCTKLEHLDIFDNRNIGKDVQESLIDIARQRKLTVVLRGLTHKNIALEDPAHDLDIWLDMIC